MKARLRFTRKAFFNYPPDRLVAPGKLIGRAEGREAWTMVFTVTKQLSALVYEGDLQWLVEPREQDFGRGTRFQFISFAGGKLEGKDKDRRDKLAQDKQERKEALAKKEANEKETGKKEERDKNARKVSDKSEDKPVDKPPKPPKPPHVPHMPDDAYAERPPVMMGVLAEGELLG